MILVLYEILEETGMMEVIRASFSWANIFPTLTLLFCMFYWIMVMIGALDLGFMDFDLDLDGEPDIEVDLGNDVPVSWWNYMLEFFNLGHIPVMVFLSFLALPLWLISVVTNYFIGNDNNFLIGIIVWIPSFIVSLMVAKIMTMPFIKLFKRLNSEEVDESIDAVGKICTVLFNLSEGRLGQAEVVTDKGHLRVNVYTNDEIKKGDQAIVIEYTEEKKSYLVAPFNS